jgi:hypothetical protein
VQPVSEVIAVVATLQLINSSHKTAIPNDGLSRSHEAHEEHEEAMYRSFVPFVSSSCLREEPLCDGTLARESQIVGVVSVAGKGIRELITKW